MEKTSKLEGNATIIREREILIKAVAMLIPIYTMSCFKLPRNFCFDLENMMAKFWWRQRQNENKIHWVSWKNMCDPKAEGDMGFKDLKTFSMTLLAKQG